MLIDFHEKDENSLGTTLNYERLKPNLCYLIGYTITCCLGSMQMGIALSSGGQALITLDH